MKTWIPVTAAALLLSLTACDSSGDLPETWTPPDSQDTGQLPADTVPFTDSETGTDTNGIPPDDSETDTDSDDDCVPKTNAELCAESEAECGTLAMKDNCEEDRTLLCGVEEEICDPFETCGGGGEANRCGCTPVTCESAGVLCDDAYPDGCGGTLQCKAFCSRKVVAGRHHVCAISDLETGGRLKCWGRNHKGQLGDGTATQRNNPVNVNDIETVTEIALGGGHTCALKAAGAVHCWGDNTNGQLGIGTTVDARVPGDPVSLGGSAIRLAAGETHACALIIGGHVRCWGYNSYGQIGHPALAYQTNAAVPSSVEGLTSNVVDITAGAYHNCALKDDNTVWCWGRNRYGQLGDLQITEGLPVEAVGLANTNPDIPTRRNTPVQVDFGTTDIQITALTAGEDSTCALDSLGRSWCWGALTRASSSANTCPICVTAECSPRNATTCAIFPSTLDGLSGLVPIVRINAATLVIDAVFLDLAALRPTQVPFASAIQSLTLGMNHLCGIMSTSSFSSNLQCLGLNTYGQCGDGTNNPWATPIDVYFDVNENPVHGQAVTLGEFFTCTLTSSENIKCFGRNNYGQIGNTALNRDESYRPFDVKLNHQF